MDGLECSEICLRQIKSDGCRIDAEYYSKQNLRLQKIVDSAGSKTISEYGGKLDCSAFYPSITKYYSDDRGNVPFIRVNEIENGLVSITSNTVFLPLSLLKENSKTIALAYPGDIIIAKGGNTLAKVGLVTDEFPTYATCRDVIILRTPELQGLNKYYLWAFLHSAYGQGILWRSASQTGQPHLTLSAITKINVPDIKALQQEIENLYMCSVSIKNTSNQLYADAENILSTILKQSAEVLDGIVITERLISKSFGITGRLDAEYYQPKYEHYTAALHTEDTVSSLCKINDKNFIPEESTKYKYIELANVGKYGDIFGIKIQTGANLPSRARRQVKTGQVIVSSVEGSLQSCALITEEFDGAICSTGFYVVESDSINSETLLVLFKSGLIQSLMKQRCSGTILTAITKDEFSSMPLPNIDNSVQTMIASKVQKSFALRKKSEQMIKYAKRAVEMAIEQSEDVAMDWLKNKLSDVEV